MLNHINKFGNIYGHSRYNYPNNSGTKINYDGDFLWSGPWTSEENAIDIHEIKQIPNGNYMAFVPDYRPGPIPEGEWTSFFQQLGYAADGVTNEYPWEGMRLVEWDENANEVWSWDPYVHFTMDDYDAYGGTWLYSFNFNIFYDWMHSNAFHFDLEESVIYVSHRHLSRISKIAYPSGEVIWNIGMPAEYNTGSNNICTDLGFSFQHNIQLLDDGSLLFFDNGNLSVMLMGDQNPTSRVRRIRVIDDTFCQTIWEYELPENLFGSGMGSVQLLDNSNYLIYTYGNGLSQTDPTILEVTEDGEVVWSYVSPVYNTAWYRAYKIPSIHPNAFSVIAENYTINNNIHLDNNNLNFKIFNKSGYSQPYKYILSNMSSIDNQMFIDVEGEVTIGPYMDADLFFEINNQNILTSNISLAIWPIHHKYSIKELNFEVIHDIVLMGDINGDSIVNILDVVSIVGFVIGTIEFDDIQINLADYNEDGSVDVLDIVSIVSFILE